MLRAPSTVKEPERTYNGPIRFLEGKPWEANFSVRDQTAKNPFSPKGDITKDKIYPHLDCHCNSEDTQINRLYGDQRANHFSADRGRSL